MTELAEKSLSAESATRRLTPERALRMAIDLHQQNRLEEAERLYRMLLEVWPESADVQHFFGFLRYQQGHVEEGIEWIGRALEIDPDYIDARNNLGNIYQQTERYEQAEACYREVIERSPRTTSAYANLGATLMRLGRFDEAICAMNVAIDGEPDSGRYHYELGNAFRKKGELANAIDAYQKALAINPDDRESFRTLSRLHYVTGNSERNCELIEQWLQRKPDDALAVHLLSAYGSAPAPERASDEFVRETFDRFAASFDGVLEKLDYRAPVLVEKVLREHSGAAAPVERLLDVGCGTGWCGPLLRPLTQRLEGLDLSSQMLARASERNVYDELHEAELTQFLASAPQRYDVLACADTLCYFGDLSAPCRAAAIALRSGGRFAFTVERHEATPSHPGSRLHEHGRYSHTEEYVRQVLEHSGFRILILETQDLRRELGKPVVGLLVVAERCDDERRPE